jgi:regulator of RNase E activity RraA
MVDVDDAARSEVRTGLADRIQDGLYVAVVCDVLDSLGYPNQAMHSRLRPLLPNRKACGFVGRARTFRWMDIDYLVPDDPYGIEIEAMDSLRPGDVVVHSTDYGGRNAPWGELMTTAAKRAGAVGCVCDSQIRDCNGIIDLGFPVYHAGIRPVDSQGRGRVMAFDVPISCGEVLVHPGDLVFADFDGVVVIPQAVEDETLRLAFDKVGRESASRRELLNGHSLREVFDRHGVL